MACKLEQDTPLNAVVVNGQNNAREATTREEGTLAKERATSAATAVLLQEVQ